jgi:hypothetical protein
MHNTLLRLTRNIVYEIKFKVYENLMQNLNFLLHSVSKYLLAVVLFVHCGAFITTVVFADIKFPTFSNPWHTE